MVDELQLPDIFDAHNHVWIPSGYIEEIAAYGATKCMFYVFCKYYRVNSDYGDIAALFPEAGKLAFRRQMRLLFNVASFKFGRRSRFIRPTL